MQELIKEPVAVAFNPDADIERATQAANALMKVVERTRPLSLGGKKYLYFEHWQTIGQFFQTTTGVEWTKPITSNDKIIGFEARALLYNKEGVVIGGAEAACMNDEINWKNKPMFQLRSMAQTRAMAKALRSRFGFIPVMVGIEATPAEEINGNEPKKYTIKKSAPKDNRKITIADLIDKIAGVPFHTKEEYEKKCRELTQLDLTEKNYDEIISRLTAIQAERSK